MKIDICSLRFRNSKHYYLYYCLITNNKNNHIMLKRSISMDNISQMTDNSFSQDSPNHIIYGHPPLFTPSVNRLKLPEITWTVSAYDEILLFLEKFSDDGIKSYYLDYFVDRGMDLFDYMGKKHPHGWPVKNSSNVCMRIPITTLALKKQHYLILCIEYMYSKSDQVLIVDGHLLINIKTIYRTLRKTIKNRVIDSFRCLYHQHSLPDGAQMYRLLFVSDKLTEGTSMLPDTMIISLIVTKMILDTDIKYMPDICQVDSLYYACQCVDIEFMSSDIRKLLYEYLDTSKMIYIRFVMTLSYFLHKKMLGLDTSNYQFYHKLDKINDMNSLIKVVENPKLCHLILLSLNSIGNSFVNS